MSKLPPPRSMYHWYCAMMGVGAFVMSFIFIAAKQIGVALAFMFIGILFAAMGGILREISNRLDRLEEKREKDDGKDARPE